MKSVKTNHIAFPCMMSDQNHDEGDSGVATVTRKKVKLPPLYKVLIHNDDYTTMEFVTKVLQQVFFKTYEEAEAIMISVHEKGTGVCGVFTREVAESKTDKVIKLARNDGHPLKCTFEPE